MLCEHCQKEIATIFLTQLFNSQVQKMDLCEGCARELGVSDVKTFGLGEVLMKKKQIAAELKKPVKVEACPACGFSRADFVAHGRLGCPECYRVFEHDLAKVIERTQKGPRHEGKRPGTFRPVVAEPTQRYGGKAEDVAWLRQALAEAVGREDFEEAARLQERIRRFGVPIDEGGDQQPELF